MTLDTIALILKFVIMFFLAATSEVAITKKIFGVGVFTFGVWLIFFRLAFLRAISAYIGVFQHEPTSTLLNMRIFFETAPVAIISDIFVLIGIFITFIWIGRLKVRNAK